MSNHKNAIIGLIGNIQGHYRDYLKEELESKGVKGLLPSHGSILACLYKCGGSVQVLEVARWLGRSKSSISELVDRLEEFGYVVKNSNDDDKRGVTVSLTRKGKDFKKHFEEISSRLLETAYKDFTEEEIDALSALLMKLFDNFKTARIGTARQTKDTD
jgi:MarR family transcriptional regulator, organic hydroperoxide resistance regulator